MKFREAEEAVDAALWEAWAWVERERKAVALALGGVAVAYVAGRGLRSALHRRRLRHAVAEKAAQREEGFRAVELFWEQASPEQLAKKEEILGLGLEALATELLEGRLSALEAVRAFQAAAVAAQRATNCLTEMVAEAEAWAREADEAGRTYRAPLFGLPFSVKESIDMAGYPSTRGYAQDLSTLASEDAVVVESLKRLGAIPIVRTNVPQSLLSFACSNPVFGRTEHPWAAGRTCGGSSGGEAALLAQGGAVFGIGGDVGGSIRMPAHFCGIAGLKPCSSRLSQRGSSGSVPGRQMVAASIGPMSPSVPILALVMKNLTTSLTYGRDAYVAPVPWRRLLFTGDLGGGTTKKLTIGFYQNDGYFTPAPAIQRAVVLARDKLQAQGHNLVQVSPPGVPRAFQLFTSCAMADGGVYLAEKLRRDLLDANLRWQYHLYALSLPAKRLLGHLLGPLVPRASAGLLAIPRSTVEMRRVFAELAEYRGEFFRWWRGEGLDGLICPPQASVATSHTAPMKLLPTVSYCALFNALDFPAGVVGVGTVSEEDARRTQEEHPTGDALDRLVGRENGAESVGLPVGVQCVALPFEEEIVLRLMNALSA